MKEWEEKELRCVVCGKELTGRQKKFCSKSCKSKEFTSNPEVRKKYQEVQNKRRQDNKKKLLELFGLRCSICNYSKNTAALEFHHINPEEKDFALSSMNFSWSFERLVEETNKCILVCANCHREEHNPESTLDNMNQFKMDNIVKFNQKTFNPDYIPEKKYCDCGQEISYDAKQCRKCYIISKQTVNRPTKEELLELIKTTSFLTIGKQYGVTDNAIRKWCKAYGLPFKQKDIKLLR